MAEIFLTVLTSSRRKHQVDLEVEKGPHTDTGLMMGEAKSEGMWTYFRGRRWPD